MIRNLINIVASIVELLLLFRLIFKFLVVNAGAPFVAWIYNITTPLIAPFAKIAPNWKYAGFVVDFATLVAIIAYSIAGYLLLMIFPHSRKRD
jgi:uncharacterized protein YggT (Ycf19 family)